MKGECRGLSVREQWERPHVEGASHCRHWRGELSGGEGVR